MSMANLAKAQRSKVATLSLLLAAMCIVGATAAPIVLQPSKLLPGPTEVTEGFGDKVALNRDGGILAVQAEWNNSANSSIFTADRVSGLTYSTWSRVSEPAILYTYNPKPEFGTTIQLTLDGQLLLATIEDISLPTATSTKLPLAFLFQKSGATFVQAGDPFIVDVTIAEPQVFLQALPNSTFKVDTTRGMISGDGFVVAISTQLAVEPPAGSNASSPSIPGKVYIFQRNAALLFYQFQVIDAPFGQIPNATFGKNAALSKDGNWLAVSEDVNAMVYVYGRAHVSDQFRFITAVKDLFNTTAEGAEVEEMTLSTDGSYLVVGWKLPENLTETATNNGTGAFGVYWRTPAWHVNGVYHESTYQCIYNITTNITGLDGLRTATVGQYLRLVLGFAGEQASIYDINTMAAHQNLLPPNLQPTFIIPAQYNNTSLNNATDPLNVQTVFEAVDISGDGLTLALGAEAQNGVYLLTLPPPGSVVY